MPTLAPNPFLSDWEPSGVTWLAHVLSHVSAPKYARGQRQDRACPCLCLAVCSRITRSQRWNDGLPSRSPARPRVRRFCVRCSRARREVTGALTLVRHMDNPAWICRILLPQISFPAHKKTHKLPTYICRLCYLGSLSRIPCLGRPMLAGISMVPRSLLAQVISVCTCTTL